MIGFLHSVFVLFSQLVKIFKKYQLDKQRQSEDNLRNKADAYDKLQKAIAARDSARKSNADDDLMSDDGYRRKQ